MMTHRKTTGSGNMGVYLEVDEIVTHAENYSLEPFVRLYQWNEKYIYKSDKGYKNEEQFR